MVKKDDYPPSPEVIKTFMSTNVVTAEVGTALQEVAKMMATKAISCVVVLKTSGEPIGILTERDFISRILAQNLPLKGLKVDDLMTTPIQSIAPENDILEVTRLSREKNIRHFPVTEKGKLVGLVTETDIFRGLLHYIRHLNWLMVERHMHRSKYRQILSEIKSFV